MFSRRTLSHGVCMDVGYTEMTTSSVCKSLQLPQTKLLINKHRKKKRGSFAGQWEENESK
jgi:hypothetical protein